MDAQPIEANVEPTLAAVASYITRQWGEPIGSISPELVRFSPPDFEPDRSFYGITVEGYGLFGWADRPVEG